MRIPVEKLRAFMVEAAVRLPLKREYAEAMVDNLITANTWGVNSHGVGRYPVYMKRLSKDLVNREPQIIVTHRYPAVMTIDGDNGLGSVVMMRALDETISAADQFGIAAAAVKGSNHFGAAGYYCKLAADRGYISLLCTVGPANMPPFGGMEPYFSTNPLAMGIPSPDGEHIIVDMATSMAAKGKIRECARKHEPIPLGWAIDKDGNPTTDAQAAVDGLVLPMSGHKGSGLALLIEAMAGVISGSAFGTEVVMQYGDETRPANVGHSLIVIRPDGYLDKEAYTARLRRFCDELHAIAPAKGFERVILPGEKERMTCTQVMEQGINIDDALYAQLQEIAAKSGIAMPDAI